MTDDPAPRGRPEDLWRHEVQQALDRVMARRSRRREPAAAAVTTPNVRDTVPLAPAVRACLDAARRLQLAAELRHGSQRGSAAPRRVLADVSAGVRSTAERDAKRLLRRSGLPEPWWDVPIHDERGRLLGVSDTWFEAVALTWEINSYAWHLNPEDCAREIGRTADMTAANVMVLPVLPTSLRQDPDHSIATLLAAYTAAALRPRPPVRAVRRC